MHDMFSRIPEEVIHTILQLLFRVNIVDHMTCIRTYPGSETLLRPPSHVLLVNKQWLRIGTPLLYQTVYITSDNGTELLANTLQKKPTLGLLIRHIRLDGGYGLPLCTIAKAASNIRVLSLDLQVRSKTSITGLLRSLPCLNLTELYLHRVTRDRREDNDESRALATAVLEAMKGWTSLVSTSTVLLLRCSCHSPSELAPRYSLQRLLSFKSCERAPNAIRILATALSSAPQTSTIAFSDFDLLYLLHIPHFQEIVLNSNVRELRCYGITGSLETLPRLSGPWKSIPEEVRRLVVYEETQKALEMLQLVQNWYELVHKLD